MTDATTLELGAAAPDFALPDLGGETVSLDALSDAPALVVAFLCNHCPYVRHIEHELGRLAGQWQQHGAAFVGVCPNDARQYPSDDRGGLAAQSARAGFTFPYLIDTAQDVARDYGAVCTPDFFVFDRNRRLAYRGAFDGSSPGNDVAVTGDELNAAVTRVLAGEPVEGPHRQPVGCSIKWVR